MEGQGENDELYPIAVLIDELKVQLLFHPHHLFRRILIVACAVSFSMMRSLFASTLYAVFLRLHWP
jgi:hypothetical protein